MSGITNSLISKSKKISDNFDARELDVLLSTGEQESISLLAGALVSKGVKSKSWLNWQIPILTSGEHGNARIININKEKINKFFSAGGIAILPGFQGISEKWGYNNNRKRWIRCNRCSYGKTF